MFSAPKAKRQVHELKTPQASLLVEETEAMPAESVRLKRNSTSLNKKRIPVLVKFQNFKDSPLFSKVKVSII